MKIEILGSGGAFDPEGTAFLVNDNILVDCGHDAVKKLMADGRLGYVDTVLITHIHTDHINGFETLVYYQRYISKTDSRLLVIAPTQFWALHDKMASALEGYKHNKARSQANVGSWFDGPRHRDQHMTINAHPVEHSGLEAFAYSLHDAHSSVVFTGDIDEPLDLPEEALPEYSYIFHDMGWQGKPPRTDKVHPYEHEVFDKFGNTNKIIGVHTMHDLRHYERAIAGAIYNS